MTRYAVIIYGPRSKRDAMEIISKAPPGTRVEIKAAKRTLPQNARMWAMLTDVALQLPWHGVKLRPDDWKLIFLDALRREMGGGKLSIVPNIDGTGFVNIGVSSSDLEVGEMGDLMTLIEKFGAEHKVKFHDSPDPDPLAHAVEEHA